jgi:hypothetical protein
LKFAGVREREAEKDASEPVRPLRLPRELRAFWIASAIGFALAFIVGWFKWRSGLSVYNWDPLSDLRFGDLLEYPGTYVLLHTRAFFFNVDGRPWAYPMYAPVAYPPFAAVVMAPIYLSGQPEFVFMLLSAAWLLPAFASVRGWMLRAGVSRWTATLFPLTVAAMSFPIARLIHEGNVELVVWVLTATGVWAWVREKNELAAILWGLAAAMKLFPLVLLALLLPVRKWRAFTVGLVTFCASTLGSLWWLGPTIADAWHGSLVNVFGYQGTRVSEWTLRELVANHSVIQLAKLGAMIVHFPLSRVTLPYYAAGALALAAAFFLKLWRMPRANQLLAVSTFMVMFPAISYYHTLVHLYAALVLLVRVAFQAERAGVQVPGLRTTMLLFVPLFVPFTVLTFPKVLLFCGLIQALVLALLFLCSLQYTFAVDVSSPAARGTHCNQV